MALIQTPGVYVTYTDMSYVFQPAKTWRGLLYQYAHTLVSGFRTPQDLIEIQNNFQRCWPGPYRVEWDESFAYSHSVKLVFDTEAEEIWWKLQNE